MDAHCDNVDRCWSKKVDNTCDGRRLIYHAERPPVYSTMRERTVSLQVAQVYLRQLTRVLYDTIGLRDAILTCAREPT